MAAIVLDTGALIAIERADRAVAALLEAAAQRNVDVLTSSACVAQAWRRPERQVRLVRALAGIVERPLDAEQARQCGVALGHSCTSDVVDGAVVTLARDGDTILTGDVTDIERLLAAIGTRARVRQV